jgi:hypothetical protein
MIISTVGTGFLRRIRRFSRKFFFSRVLRNIRWRQDIQYLHFKAEKTDKTLKFPHEIPIKVVAQLPQNWLAAKPAAAEINKLVKI